MLDRTQIVDAFIALAFGVGLLLLPELVLAIYGAATDSAGIVLGRLLGVLLLGFAGVNWYIGHAPESPLRRDIVRSEGLADILGLIVMLFATVGGVVNALGWTLVALFAVLAGVRLYYTSAAVEQGMAAR